MATDNLLNRTLIDQFKAVTGVLGATMTDVTAEVANWKPGGLANPVGTTYAHLLVVSDAFLNGILRGGAPLFASTFAGKTGISELPPMPDPGNPRFAFYADDCRAWALRATIDLDAIRPFAAAVFASVEEWLAGVTEETLAAPVDLSFLGMGISTAGFVLHNAILAHIASHAGEIAAIKGLQGLKGYPF